MPAAARCRGDPAEDGVGIIAWGERGELEDRRQVVGQLTADQLESLPRGSGA